MQHVATLVTWSTILLLVMTSILSHPYAAAVLTSAQALVSFFRASHRPYEVLKAACRAANPPVNTGLRSANTTRLTSSFDMLGSVLVPRPAFQAFAFVEVECDPTLLPAKQAGMLVNLKSETWWSDLQQVHELLRPFAEVVMAIQAHDSTLADVTRYWLYLNQATEALLPQLSSAAFQQHVCAAFNKRAVEMDSPLCRLALFLDPRYRAIGGSQAALEELTKVVSTLQMGIADGRRWQESTADRSAVAASRAWHVLVPLCACCTHIHATLFHHSSMAAPASCAA
jgi:hypothetical protein